MKRFNLQVKFTILLNALALLTKELLKDVTLCLVFTLTKYYITYRNNKQAQLQAEADRLGCLRSTDV